MSSVPYQYPASEAGPDQYDQATLTEAFDVGHRLGIKDGLREGTTTVLNALISLGIITTEAALQYEVAIAMAPALRDA